MVLLAYDLAMRVVGSGSGARVRLAAGVLALATSCLVAGCSADEQLPAKPPPAEPMGAAELRDLALDLVDDREAALREGDKDAFMVTVDPKALQFVATQERWWDNLAQLPLADVDLEPVEDESLVPEVAGADLVIPVDFTMRLDGYESGAVTRRQVYSFRQDGDGVVLLGDRDRAEDVESGWIGEPWETSRIVVRKTPDLLVVFDEDTEPWADSVMGDLEKSRRIVKGVVPGWSGKVVAYDVTDTTRIEDGSAMQVWETGGIAFPVYAEEGSDEVAAHRFVVNPEAAHNSTTREFLLPHEIAHIAIAERDDSSPRWLVEGTAEYVARAGYSPDQQRRLAGGALYVLASDPYLANGSDFYSNPAANYELAGAVCTYLAQVRGRGVLWSLIDAYSAESERRDGRPIPADVVDDILRGEIGMDGYTLTERALTWAAG